MISVALIERMAEIDRLEEGELPAYEGLVLRMCASVEHAISEGGHLETNHLADALLRIIRVAKEAA